MTQATFAAKVRSILSDNAGVRLRPRQRYGPFLDTPRLALVGAGETRVFAKAERRQFHRYHVVLVVDCSGSMDTRRRYVAAAQMSHALTWALEQAGATVEIVLFNACVQLMAAAATRPYKTWLQTIRQSLQAWGGSNRDGAAVWLAERRLRMSTAPGKLCVVISDGQPAANALLVRDFPLPNVDAPYAPPRPRTAREKGPAAYQRQAAQEFKALIQEGEAGDKYLKNTVVHHLRRRGGVDLIAVGVDTSDPRQYYGERHTAVCTAPTLYARTAQILAKALRRG